MKSIIKRLIVSMMALAMVLAGIQVSSMRVDAASTTGKVPISCYTLSGRVTTYTTKACTTVSGYIDSVDLTKIKAFYSEYSSVQVEYPTNKGKKTAYAKVSAFFQDVNFSTSTGKTGKELVAYRRSTGTATIGTVYATDICIVTGYANGRTQLIYPVGNGSTFKMGWVSGTYSFNSGSSSFGSATVSNGTYTLVSALNNNYVADISGGALASQANCQLYQSNGSNAQKFTLTYNSDGYYTIKNVGSGKVLDCAGASSANGTNVWQYDSNSSSAQRWKITGAGNGYYTITCKCNGKCLDVSGGNVYNGNNIQIYESNGTNSQKWKLVSTSANTSSSSSTPVAQQMVNYELSQLGIGDYKGNNNVKYNTWYYGRNVSGNGYAWCMAFQAYCCNQITGSNNAIPKTASCTSAVNIFKSRGQFQYSKYYGGNYAPKAGDLVYYTNGSKFSSCHVGMIISASVNGYLQTVEGNIVCSDGNYKVVKFTNNPKRTINSRYVLGYATPNY